MIWARHRDLATLYCAVRSVSDGSYIAYDGGRWNIGDIDQFETVATAPPTEKQCGACVRAVGAERFLAHAQANPFPTTVLATSDHEPLFDAEMPDTRFDDGGEA